MGRPTQGCNMTTISVWEKNSEDEFVEHWLHDDGPCPACAAVWVDRERVHDEDCAYLAWQDKEDEAHQPILQGGTKP